MNDGKSEMIIFLSILLQKKGIWPSLDEESKFQLGTDFNFVKRLKDNFPKGHACYPLLTFARGDRIGFGVKHFAGAVSDFVNLFCDALITKHSINYGG